MNKKLSKKNLEKNLTSFRGQMYHKILILKTYYKVHLALIWLYRIG